MEGYKVFESDWTCRGFQYEVGKTFEEDVTPSCCNRGFHFCKELKDWDSLSERYKNIIKAMPNFDKEIFEDVTGIKI